MELELGGVVSVADLGGVLRQLKRRQARETNSAEYTIRELAGKLGYSAGIVGAYIQGTALAPPDKFDALVQLLGASGPEQSALATVRDLVDENRRKSAASARRSTQFEDGTFPILPRDVESFTGRRDQLESVLGLPEVSPAAAPRIVAIDGMPGVGKTAFAIQVANRLAAKFPDGQIFLSLNAHTPGVPPLQPGEALSSLLQSTGVTPRQIPADPQAMQAQWRARLAAKRILLVLDDALSSEQVLPLLPATSDAMVLVTSRRRLPALDRATPVSLPVLYPSEAAELLVAAAGRPDLDPADELVREVVRQCDYLPLAITLAGSRLRHRPAWTLTDVSHDLAAAAGRLAALRAEHVSVTAAFDLSYRELDPDLQRLFRRLAQVTGRDVELHCAAAIEAATPDRAREKLADLVDQHLIEEPVRGRYRMHDLLRDYARALTPDDPADRDLAIKRSLDYYCWAAFCANQYIACRNAAPRPTRDRPSALPDLHTPRQSFIWMQEEWPNLRSNADYAHDQHQPDVVRYLALALHGFLRAHGHWHADLELQHRAADAARQADPAAYSAALVNLADAQYMLDQYPAALETLGRALDLDDRQVAGRADILSIRGNVQRQTAALQDARGDLEQAAELYRIADDQNGRANALTYLGDVCIQSGDLDAARELLELALELFLDLDQPVGQSHALMFLGDVERQSGDYARAASLLERALVLFADHENHLGRANALVYLGITRYLSGQFELATDNLQAALVLQRTLGDRLGIAGTLTILGDVCTQTGQLDAAISSLEQALGLFRELGHTAGEANTLNYLGHAQGIVGEFAFAEENLAAALRFFTQLDMPGGITEALNHLGELMTAYGKLGDALSYHNQALDTARTVNSPLDEAKALRGLARVAGAAERTADEISYLGQALVIYDRIGAPAAEPVRHRLEHLQPRPSTED
jgi:tetratricopeptide (TPR) repeat protein